MAFTGHWLRYSTTPNEMCVHIIVHTPADIIGTRFGINIYNIDLEIRCQTCEREPAMILQPVTIIIWFDPF